MKLLLFKYVYKLIGKALDLWADMKPEFDAQRAEDAAKAVTKTNGIEDAKIIEDDD